MSAEPAIELTGVDKDLGGGFTVRRLLPAARRRSVGPFVFFDHFGPVLQVPGASHDVRPHPHIGLATITYLFEGAMMHRDSLGSSQLIVPGAINLMTAGRGIVHSERRPDHLRQTALTLQGLQMWVALPEALQECEPAFAHTPAEAIPHRVVDGCEVRVLVGQAFGARSPVVTASPITLLDLQLPAGAALSLDAPAPEWALYLVSGAVTVDGEPLAAHRMRVFDAGLGVQLRASADARVVLAGGEPLGRRHLWWNFVHSDASRIHEAAADWQAGRFAPVPGETESIALPEQRFSAPPQPL